MDKLLERKRLCLEKVRWGHQRGLVSEKQECQAELFNATIASQ
jgi:hypothetical protein